ncbi:MAG TPA: hypothetical protein VIQ30_13905 [Pseudonocardia sp.]
MAEPGEQKIDNPDMPGLGTSERSTHTVTQPLDSPTTAPAPVGRRRRNPDLLTLVVGLMSLAAAVLILTGWIPQLRMFDLRWVLSGGAVVVGVLLLAASARSPRKP